MSKEFPMPSQNFPCHSLFFAFCPFTVCIQEKFGSVFSVSNLVVESCL